MSITFTNNGTNVIVHGGNMVVDQETIIGSTLDVNGDTTLRSNLIMPNLPTGPLVNNGDYITTNDSYTTLPEQVGRLENLVNILLTYGGLSPAQLTIPGNAPSSLANLASYDTTKTDQTITMTGNNYVPPQQYLHTYDFSMTCTSGLSVNAAIVTGPATLTNVSGPLWRLTATDVGIVTFIAFNNGNATYNPVVENYSFQIAKADQILSFSPIAPYTKQYTDASFNFSVSSTSGLTVSDLSSSNPTVLTISGTGPNFKATINQAGSAIITAKQAGDIHYNAATPATALVTISKSDQSITGLDVSYNKTYRDASFNVTLSSTTSGINSLRLRSSDTNILDISGISPNFRAIIKQATTVPVTLYADQSGNDNYNAAPQVTSSVIISKSSQTITGLSASYNKTYGTDTSFNVTLVSATSGTNPLRLTSSNPTVLSISGTSPNFKATINQAGSATLYGDQSGNINYNEATQVTSSVTVNKSNNTLTIAPSSFTKTYGTDTSFNFTVSATSGLTTFDVSSLDTTIFDISNVSAGNYKATIKKAGTSKISAYQSASTNYLADSALANVTINKGNHTVNGLAASYTKARGSVFDLSLSDTANLGTVTLVDSRPTSPGRATITGPAITGNVYAYHIALNATSTKTRTFNAAAATDINYNDATASASINIT